MEAKVKQWMNDKALVMEDGDKVRYSSVLWPDYKISKIANFTPFAQPVRMGYAGPMQVAHNVQLLPAPHDSHSNAPLLMLAMAMLRVDYMISELRFKGNAYGANCSYMSDVIALTTYADPNIARTLDVFGGLTNYVENAPWTDTEVTRGVLSTAKAYVRPLRPESANKAALIEYLTGRDYDRLTRRYEVLRNATPEQVKGALLPVLKEGFKNAPIGVVSSKEKLEAANKELDEPLKIEPLL